MIKVNFARWNLKKMFTLIQSTQCWAEENKGEILKSSKEHLCFRLCLKVINIMPRSPSF